MTDRELSWCSESELQAEWMKVIVSCDSLLRKKALNALQMHEYGGDGAFKGAKQMKAVKDFS